MGHAFKITQGDALPVFSGVCEDEHGDSVSLATASQVQFKLRASGVASYHIATDAAWSLATSGASVGHVSYPWAGAGTDTPSAGYFEARVVAVFSGSRAMSFPNPGHFPVTIGDS